MSHQDFAVRVEDLLSRALERERGHTEPSRAFAALTVHVGTGIARAIGDDAWEALLARARGVDDDERRVLVTLAAILSRLVGADLALRLLEQASEHPDDPPAGGPHG